MVGAYTRKVGDVWFGVAFEGERIYATGFGPNKENVLQSLRASVPSNAPFQFSKEPSAFVDRVIAVLKDVYDGKDVSQNFAFETKHLSSYAKGVIEAACLIPPGYVASYGGVAHAAGGSPRAVGRVMATNPFVPLCPCHRVVASDFRLCGYGGGLDVKLAFLKREKRGHTSKKLVNAKRGKLELFPVEFVLDRAEKSKC
jgi:O-6-methylguanine DNA methyltransferase